MVMRRNSGWYKSTSTRYGVRNMLRKIYVCHTYIYIQSILRLDTVYEYWSTGVHCRRTTVHYIVDAFYALAPQPFEDTWSPFASSRGLLKIFLSTIKGADFIGEFLQAKVIGWSPHCEASNQILLSLSPICQICGSPSPSK
jgi:hypothetical protein